MTLKPSLTMNAIRNDNIDNQIKDLQIELLKVLDKAQKKAIKGQIKVLNGIKKSYANLLKY